MSATTERLMNFDTPLVEHRMPDDDGKEPLKVRKITATIPKSINMRIRAIAKAERRNLGVVISKCIEDYLSAGNDESRPYIPHPLYHEDTVKLSQTFPTEIYDQLKSRAENEGRTISMILIKALFEYISASPDDPVRFEPSLEPESKLEPNSDGDE